MNKNPKSKWQDAERAAVHFAVHCMDCIITRRAVRAKFQSVDFFACDVVGKQKDGSHVYIQVTTGQAPAVTARKRKIEKIPWHHSDIVLILQLFWLSNPKNKRKKDWYFKVFEYSPLDERSCQRNWDEWVGGLNVDKNWFKAYEEAK